jgi:hypothetical protein
MDEQTSQPTEDRYSSRVDEPETDVEPDEEWFDDDADEDKLAQRNGRPATRRAARRPPFVFTGEVRVSRPGGFCSRFRLSKAVPSPPAHGRTPRTRG